MSWDKEDCAPRMVTSLSVPTSIFCSKNLRLYLRFFDISQLENPYSPYSLDDINRTHPRHLSIRLGRLDKVGRLLTSGWRYGLAQLYMSLRLRRVFGRLNWQTIYTHRSNATR